VEHPHFTPERIRQLAAERLDELAVAGASNGEDYMRRIVEDELARPTEAMRNSFRALEDEHRELLISLLDAPAGLIDERGLAATVRRYHAGGLRRPSGELIDRLSDHFLRVTPRRRAEGMARAGTAVRRREPGAVRTRRHRAELAQARQAAVGVPAGGVACRQRVARRVDRTAADRAYMDRASPVAVTTRRGSHCAGPPGAR
jgi:hypothetical protein